MYIYWDGCFVDEGLYSDAEMQPLLGDVPKGRNLPLQVT